ncbi:alpha/beta fold hydrolase [Oleomonas cavernae]|uniref:Alpha/beta fold hydrolase n=2 Tax=Oleomonas cavernae TaxID=2320859 RepID=A0A418VUL5_9PROT|nr:alpha/beta fold hydrolase [Oleomonas cavernae]
MVGSLSAPALALTEEAVSLGLLQGTLALPPLAAGNRVPAVLILAGSGPVDRDGNLPGMINNSLRLVAHGLAEQGIASLRVDKRGIAESGPAGPREEDLRFQTFVDDALAWAESLRQDPRIGPIYLLGHSEGALVVTLAAQKAPKGSVSGLILLAGAGQSAAQVIERQLAEMGVSAALQAASKHITDELVQGRHVADVPPDLAALYRPSVQDYLISWLPLDPAAELARTDVPVLIVQGTIDIQISVADARLLQAARPDAKLVLIEGMNHVLKRAPANRFLNRQTYAIPLLPLADGLLPAITDFIGGR